MKYLVTDFTEEIKLNGGIFKQYLIEIGWGDFPFEVTDTGRVGGMGEGDKKYPVCANQENITACLMHFQYKKI